MWLILAGRGFGKTRAGAEWVRGLVESGEGKRIALIAPTASDARDVMVEGESGLLNICPPDFKPLYEPSKRRLTWPNGAVATTYSADEPERLRGPQHDFGWCDEIAAWRYPATFDMFRFGLRLGKRPRSLITTTPKPIKLLRQLVTQDNVVITRGSTFENKANLARAFIDEITRQYEGTRLGRQELWAEILDDAAGALWTRAMLEQARTNEYPDDLERVVVAIDPAVTSKESSDETGIVVCGRKGHRGFILADHSGRYSPNEWARKAVEVYHRHGADRIVAEVNNGGDLVQSVLQTGDRRGSYKAVRASRGKRTRAEPVAALFEQQRVSICGAFNELEDQLCTWDASDGSPSPDRLDAMVWGLHELMGTPRRFRDFRHLPPA